MIYNGGALGPDPTLPCRGPVGRLAAMSVRRAMGLILLEHQPTDGVMAGICVTGPW